MSPRRGDHEVVLLVLNRNKAKIVPTSYSLDRQTPICATLRYCFSDRVMGGGLRPIAGRLVTSQQAVNQDPRAASPIAAYHHAAGLHARSRNGGFSGLSLEPAIPWSEDNSLQATVTVNEVHPRCQKWFVVLTGRRIHEVNGCHVAF